MLVTWIVYVSYVYIYIYVSSHHLVHWFDQQTIKLPLPFIAQLAESTPPMLALLLQAFGPLF